MRLNAAVLTTLTVMALVATAHGQTFAPGLSGVREVGAPGDPDGAGLAVITLEGGSAHYYLWVAATDQPTAAHVHAGLAGENGSVALDLAPAFQAAGGGTFVAVGSVAIAPALAAAILQNPAGYYANIHTAAFPAGAVRGQLLGDGAPRGAFGASLFGRREAPTAGDPDGQGFATAVISGASLHFYIRVKDIASPTAAHVHRGDGGQSGPVVLDFAPQFAAGVARGEVALAAGLAAELLADPAGFYFNVHNGQFPAGALRGQLGATETVLHFPVAARNPGAGTSAFKSDLRVVAAGDQETPVWAEWYPANSGGSTGPAARARFSVAAGGVAVIDDVVGTLFGANARGAIRLLAAQPISAGINTYNDQRAVGSGTFGQFQAGLGLEHAARAGSLGLGSHRPKADLVDFRTNVGYFNPGPVPAVVRFNVKRPDGAVTNSQAITIPGWANDLRLYHDIISDVPAGERTKADFLVTYNSDRPVFIYSSVVDNRTDDGLHQPAAPFPPDLTEGVNQPPEGTILEPSGNVAVQVGQPVAFAGSVIDPEGQAVTVRWEFGDQVDSPELATTHAYLVAGTYTVTFTATDSAGASDPVPDTRVVTVTPQSAPSLTAIQESVFSPRCSGCHPPNAGLNLSPGASHGALVNVSSGQQPALLRVKPGDPTNSYLVRKLEGAAGIAGSRMPQGGPYLTEAELQQIRQWILAGAPNN